MSYNIKLLKQIKQMYSNMTINNLSRLIYMMIKTCIWILNLLL